MDIVSIPRGGRVIFRRRLELMYRQNLSLVDSSPELGQVFPGFPLEVPKLA